MDKVNVPEGYEVVTMSNGVVLARSDAKTEYVVWFKNNRGECYTGSYFSYHKMSGLAQITAWKGALKEFIDRIERIPL